MKLKKVTALLLATSMVLSSVSVGTFADELVFEDEYAVTAEAGEDEAYFGEDVVEEEATEDDGASDELFFADEVIDETAGDVVVEDEYVEDVVNDAVDYAFVEEDAPAAEENLSDYINEMALDESLDEQVADDEAAYAVDTTVTVSLSTTANDPLWGLQTDNVAPVGTPETNPAVFIYGQDPSKLPVYRAIQVGTDTGLYGGNPEYEIYDADGQLVELDAVPLSRVMLTYNLLSVDPTLTVGDPDPTSYPVTVALREEILGAPIPTLTYNYKQFDNVGANFSVSMNVSANDTAHYRFVRGNYQDAFTVSPKSVTVTWDSENIFFYDGTKHTYKGAKVDDLENNDAVTVVPFGTNATTGALLGANATDIDPITQETFTITNANGEAILSQAAIYDYGLQANANSLSGTKAGNYTLIATSDKPLSTVWHIYTAMSKETDYNGEPQTIDVSQSGTDLIRYWVLNSSDATGGVPVAPVAADLSTDTGWSKLPPKYTHAGEYTIYYQTRDDYRDPWSTNINSVREAKLIINPVSITATLKDITTEYGVAPTSFVGGVGADLNSFNEITLKGNDSPRKLLEINTTQRTDVNNVATVGALNPWFTDTSANPWVRSFSRWDEDNQEWVPLTLRTNADASRTANEMTGDATDYTNVPNNAGDAEDAGKGVALNAGKYRVVFNTTSGANNLILAQTITNDAIATYWTTKAANDNNPNLLRYVRNYNITVPEAIITVTPVRVRVRWDNEDELDYTGDPQDYAGAEIVSLETNVVAINNLLPQNANDSGRIQLKESNVRATNVGEYTATIDSVHFIYPTPADAIASTNAQDPADTNKTNNFVIVDADKTHTWTIGKKKVAVQVVPTKTSISYGEDDPVASYGMKDIKVYYYVDGVLGEEADKNQLSGTPKFTTTYQKWDDVGEYEVKVEGLTSENYKIEKVEPGKFKVTQVTADVVPTDVIVPAGQDPATLEYTFAGKGKEAAEHDDAAKKFKVTLTTTPAQPTAVGNYPIAAAIDPADYKNIKFNTKTGTYTVAKGELSLKISDYRGGADGTWHGLTIEPAISALPNGVTVYFAEEELNAQNFDTVGRKEEIKRKDVGETKVYYYVDAPDYEVEMKGNKTITIIDENQAKAEEVTEQINDAVTPDEQGNLDATKVKEARDAYDALTDEQKKLVDPYAVKALQEAEKKVAADAAKKIEDALPKSEPLTDKDREAVDAAKAIYDNLTDAEKAEDAVKAAKAKLDAADAAVKADETQKASAVADLIKALPEADKVTDADKANIDAARAAYDALTPAEKELVGAENLKKLEDDEAALRSEDEKAAKAVEDAIKALPDPDKATAADKEKADAAKAAYDALTDAQKALVDPEAVKKMNDVKAAADAAAEEEAKVKKELEDFDKAVAAVKAAKNGVDGKKAAEDAAKAYDGLSRAARAAMTPEEAAAYEATQEAYKKDKTFESGEGVFRVLSNGEVTYLKPLHPENTWFVVPNQVKKKGFTYKVVKVSTKAFMGCTAATKIKIGKNVQSMGSYVFKNTPAMTKLIFLTSKLGSGKVKDTFVSGGKDKGAKLTNEVPNGKSATYQAIFVGEGGMNASAKFTEAN
jgi:hypothetical protein